jgi:hypothetical protein
MRSYQSQRQAKNAIYGAQKFIRPKVFITAIGPYPEPDISRHHNTCFFKNRYIIMILIYV